MESYASIANSPLLWGITALAVGLVLFQTIIFLKKSFKAGKEMGISEEKMKTAFITGSISSIGPSIVIVIGMVSLLIVVGGPTALMRLAYIGNVAYELLAAQFAADAYGVVLTDPSIPQGVFVTTLWAMAVGCIGWIVFTALITDKMDKFKNKFTGGASRMVPVISTAAMLGAYGYLNAGYAISMDGKTVALSAGFLLMLAIMICYKKTKKKWLNEWGLTIAMVGGVLCAVLI
ncbi:hypothetical protein SDC9_101017 [bioreactor metagenome]|jgi:hypothetical protein|uniref:DUF5058 domain-containing protein n=1 Tax=bioreactor metagenome TaxID=1076179 RepID=A0A645ALX0_9ZZZZ|nr:MULTISPECIES: DUF5058 family protein [unclassified Aminobacterium]MEA4878467.1 DUF5058 family protein [Aminobacterium sp.]WMI71012.1 DUF5058 family protein [Aminobacterium sp. MB27-C1]